MRASADITVSAPTGRIDEIELLRALAVLLVVLEHAHGNLITWPLAAFDAFNRHFNGGAGVDLFFAISGFVIARDLLPRLSKPMSGHDFLRISMAFWVRRAWRILPSAWLWLGLILLATLGFNQSGAFHSFEASLAGTIAAVLQFYNAHFALCFMRFDCGANFVYWSLSLEEQFYLLLPFLLYFSRASRVPLLLALIAVQMLSERSLWLLMFRTDALLLGVLLAELTLTGQTTRYEPRWLRHLWAWHGCMLLALIALLAATAAEGVLPAGYRYGAVALCAALPVWLASFNRGYLMPASPIRHLLLWLGSRSYAIYLIHVPVFYAVRELAFRLAPASPPGGMLPTIAYISAATAAIVALAELNFRWIETPLRQKGATIAARINARAAPIAASTQGTH
jgi:peptidoglycan/LPS O-acetylase OafA/YrhL